MLGPDHVSDLGPSRRLEPHGEDAAEPDQLARGGEEDARVVRLGVPRRQERVEPRLRLGQVRVGLAERRPRHDLALRAQRVERAEVVLRERTEDEARRLDCGSARVRRERPAWQRRLHLDQGPSFRCHLLLFDQSINQSIKVRRREKKKRALISFLIIQPRD